MGWFSKINSPVKSARTTRGFLLYPLTLLCIATAQGYILSRPTVDCSFCGRGQGSRVCGRGISPLRRRPKDGARLAALQSPFGNLRPLRGQSLAGRGGSVSRRDHNQAYRRRVTFQAEPTEKKCRNPNASRSSGKGVWGERRFSQSSGLSPQRLPHTSLREGARGRVLLFREAPSLAITYSIIARSTVRLFSFWRWRDRRRRPSAERCQCRGRSKSASRGNQRIADAFPARQ